MRRSKASMICKKTKNLRAVPIFLAHAKMKCTARHVTSLLKSTRSLNQQLN